MIEGIITEGVFSILKSQRIEVSPKTNRKVEEILRSKYYKGIYRALKESNKTKILELEEEIDDKIEFKLALFLSYLGNKPTPSAETEN